MTISRKREIEIKRNRAIRELKIEGIFIYEGNYVKDMLYSELKQLYETVFKKQLTRKSRKDRNNKKGYVYFIGSLKEGVCKIGFSNNVFKRLKGVQTGCPYKLEILKIIYVEKEIEKEMHCKYQQYRLEGEWFKIEGDLMNFLNTE